MGWPEVSLNHFRVPYGLIDSNISFYFRSIIAYWASYMSYGGSWLYCPLVPPDYWSGPTRRGPQWTTVYQYRREFQLHKSNNEHAQWWGKCYSRKKCTIGFKSLFVFFQCVQISKTADIQIVRYLCVFLQRMWVYSPLLLGISNLPSVGIMWGSLMFPGGNYGSYQVKQVTWLSHIFHVCHMTFSVTS